MKEKRWGKRTNTHFCGDALIEIEKFLLGNLLIIEGLININLQYKALIYIPINATHLVYHPPLFYYMPLLEKLV